MEGRSRDHFGGSLRTAGTEEQQPGLWQVYEAAAAARNVLQHPPPHHQSAAAVAAAAAAAGLHPHLLPPGAATLAAAAAAAAQQSSLNMMMHHPAALTSPSNSNPLPPNAAPPGGAPQYLLVGHHQGLEGNNANNNSLSPNNGSTPPAGGNALPPPSVTPPTLPIELTADRNWTQNTNLYLGSTPILGHHQYHQDNKVHLDDNRLKQQDCLQLPTFENNYNAGRGNDYSRYGYHRTIPGSSNGASPPVSGLLRPMPPRPRPEGGQEQSSENKEEFVIGPWDEDASDPMLKTTNNHQHHSNQQPMNILPPTYFMPNASGAPPIPIVTSKHEDTTNKYDESMIGLYSNSSRPWEGYQNNNGQWRGRNNQYRGRGHRGARKPLTTRSSDLLLQEKKDGKKSAIAETIAMMSKMKLEEKERNDRRKKEEHEVDIKPEPRYRNKRNYRQNYAPMMHHNSNYLLGFYPSWQNGFYQPGSYPLIRNSFYPPPLLQRAAFRGPPPPIMIGYSAARLPRYPPRGRGGRVNGGKREVKEEEECQKKVEEAEEAEVEEEEDVKES